MNTAIGRRVVVPAVHGKHVGKLGHTSRLCTYDFLVLLIPLSGFLEVTLIGRLFVPDMVMLALFPILVLSMRHKLAAPLMRRMLLFGMIWLLGQVVTDVIRQTPFHDYSRGWAKIVFTIIDFCVIYLLIDNRPRRIFLYAAGLAGSGILGFYLYPRGFALGHPWKFGIGAPVTLLIVLLAVWANHRRDQRLPLVLIALIGLFNIYMSFRSLGGLCLLTFIVLLVQRRVLRKNNYRAPNCIRFRTAIFLCVVLGGGAYLTLAVYEKAVLSGMLGEEALLKYRMQSGSYGILLGGRAELLVSSRAIMDSPIIGHGSWAKNRYYAELLFVLKHQLGYEVHGGPMSDLIPTHSHLMGAWVEAGILGPGFWVASLVLSWRALLLLLRTKNRLAPLLVFFAALLIWDILFSPYGAQRRFISTYYVVAMIAFLTSVTKLKKDKQRHESFDRHHFLQSRKISEAVYSLDR